MTSLFEGMSRAQMIHQIHLETDTSSWCYRVSDGELIESYKEIFGHKATPITAKEFSEWVQKTFKECQDKAWGCA